MLRLLEAVDASGDDDRCRIPRDVKRGADSCRRLDVAPERTASIGKHRRHALPPAGPGVGVCRPADLRLLGILELAAARQRQEIHTGPRELYAEVCAVVYRVASRNTLVAE